MNEEWFVLRDRLCGLRERLVRDEVALVLARVDYKPGLANLRHTVLFIIDLPLEMRSEHIEAHERGGGGGGVKQDQTTMIYSVVAQRFLLLPSSGAVYCYI